jgi:hypothetical protein
MQFTPIGLWRAQWMLALVVVLVAITFVAGCVRILYRIMYGVPLRIVCESPIVIRLTIDASDGLQPPQQPQQPEPEPEPKPEQECQPISSSGGVRRRSNRTSDHLLSSFSSSSRLSSLSSVADRPNVSPVSTDAADAHRTWDGCSSSES